MLPPEETGYVLYMGQSSRRQSLIPGKKELPTKKCSEAEGTSKA